MQVPTDTLADRANGDVDKLVSPLVPLLNQTSKAVQIHLSMTLDHGIRFGLKGYLQSTLQKPLATLMTASHLAGVRRADLMYEQSKPKNAKASLELSFFSGVMQYFRNKPNLDIAALQKKYNTVAFEAINGVADRIKAEISKSVDKLIEEGAHVREAKEVLGKKFAEFDIRPASKSQFETIFRTQSQIVFASGKYWSEHNDAELYDALWGYKYVTVGDDRVRPTHAILDGVTLPKSSEFWTQFYPPNGWNCRCQAIPIFERVEAVPPMLKLPDGSRVRPDLGFAWNAGHVFNAMGA